MFAQALRNNLSTNNDISIEVSGTAETVERVETVETKPDIDDDAYNFVENPEEVIVDFPVVPVVKLEEKLPFFKSITFKLAAIYG